MNYVKCRPSQMTPPPILIPLTPSHKLLAIPTQLLAIPTQLFDMPNNCRIYHTTICHTILTDRIDILLV
jgi:hypothetical protein